MPQATKQHITPEVRPAYRAAFHEWRAIVAELDSGRYPEIPDDRYRCWRRAAKRFLAMQPRNLAELCMKAECVVAERDIELSDETWSLVRSLCNVAGAGASLPERRYLRWPEADSAIISAVQ
jgi:hypothetical protein